MARSAKQVFVVFVVASSRIVCALLKLVCLFIYLFFFLLFIAFFVAREIGIVLNISFCKKMK